MVTSATEQNRDEKDTELVLKVLGGQRALAGGSFAEKLICGNKHRGGGCNAQGSCVRCKDDMLGDAAQKGS